MEDNNFSSFLNNVLLWQFSKLISFDYYLLNKLKNFPFVFCFKLKFLQVYVV